MSYPGSQTTDEALPDDAAPRLTVLHVDDDPMNLWVVQDVLSAFGHRAIKAEGAQAGLAALEARAFDAVLMDIHMPGMSGIEVLQRVRAGAGPNRDTPVIALTADVLSRTRQEYLALGFNDYVPKPILVARLLSALTRATTKDEPSSLAAPAAAAARA